MKNGKIYIGIICYSFHGFKTPYSELFPSVIYLQAQNFLNFMTLIS